MSTNQLFELLSSIHPLTPEFKEAIEKEVSFLNLPKDYHLLKAPGISEYVYFLDQGFALSYIFINGKKQIQRFWKSGQIIMSAKSFFEQIPSEEFIQLQISSDVLFISYSGVQRLFDKFPEAHFIYRVIMNEYYDRCCEQIRDLRGLNGEERFDKLIETFSNIEQIISQEYISSYLGITPQSLSRIKRRKHRS